MKFRLALAALAHAIDDVGTLLDTQLTAPLRVLVTAR